MSNQEKRTIIVNTLFYIVFTMYSSFMNVYLYAYTKSFLVMSWFVVVRMIPFPFMSVIGARMLKKHSIALPIGSGLFFLILSLIISLYCTDLFIINPYYSLLVALVCGIGFGFYWYGMNLASQVVPTYESRSNFIAKKTFFSNITTMIAPLLATFIIDSSMDDVTGYRNILIFIVVVCVIISFLAIKIDAKADVPHFTLIQSLIFKDDNHKNMLLSYFWYGINDALFLTLTGILVSNAAGSGSLYSKLLTFFSVLQIIFSRTLPWMVKKQRVKQAFVITGIINMSSTIVLVLFPTVWGAIYYGVAHAIYNVYEHMNSYFIGQITSRYDNIPEVVTARQTYNSLGRIVGMLFIFLCYFVLPEELYFKVSVIVCSLAPILVIYYDNKLMKTIYKF